MCETTIRPRVTVVVTCYNQAHLIEQALNSVKLQSERRIRLVITDDGSTDGSREVIERWVDTSGLAATFLGSEKNCGLTATLNRALPYFAGDYVVVLNGDDWMEVDRIQVQADFLDGQPNEVGVLYSVLRAVDEFGVPTGVQYPKPGSPTPEGLILHDLIRNINLGMPSLMVRRSVFGRIGPWDETLIADDFDFLLRTAEAGFEFRFLPVCAVNYRVYADSMTKSRQGELIESRIRALEKLLGRSPETDQAINERVEGLIVALEDVGYDREVVRSAAIRALARRRSRRLIRVALESTLGLRSRQLSIRRRVHRESEPKDLVGN